MSETRDRVSSLAHGGGRADESRAPAPGDRDATARAGTHAAGEAPGSAEPDGPARTAGGPGRPGQGQERRAVVAALFMLSMLARASASSPPTSACRGALGRRDAALQPGARHCPCRWPSSPWASAPPSGSGTIMPDVEHGRAAARRWPPQREDREAFAETFTEGAEASSFVKRPLLRRTLIAGHACRSRSPRWCCCATWARCPGPACGTRSGARACGWSSYGANSRCAPADFSHPRPA